MWKSSPVDSWTMIEFSSCLPGVTRFNSPFNYFIGLYRNVDQAIVITCNKLSHLDYATKSAVLHQFLCTNHRLLVGCQIIWPKCEDGYTHFTYFHFYFKQQCVLHDIRPFNLFPPLWSLHWDWAHNTCLIWNGLSNYFHCCKIESNWVLCIRLRTLTKRGYYILSQPKCTKNITYQTVAACSFFLLYCCQIRPTVCQLSTCGQCPLIRLESSLDIEQSAP